MHRSLRYSILFGLNLFLGVTAVGGGLAILVGWISMPLSSLAGSSFSDYSVPAILLIVAVGGTSLLAAWAVRVHTMRTAVPLSAIAGGTIIIFEIVEWSIIGFAWLQAIYIGIGVAIIATATWIRTAYVLRHITHRAPPRAA